jgi:dihydrofolate reductase
MSTLTAIVQLSLDGVMQAPGGADEDPGGGFEHGGWAAPYSDPVMGEVMGRGMAAGMAGGAMLFGRRTYENFASYWPQQTDNPFTSVLNAMTKYVVSNTLQDPLPWENSVLVTGDGAAAVAELKQGDRDLVVLGSGELLRRLMPQDLVDSYLLNIHPLVLGSGRRLFPDRGALARLQLADCTPTTTGVIMATYTPER